MRGKCAEIEVGGYVDDGRKGELEESVKMVGGGYKDEIECEGFEGLDAN